MILHKKKRKVNAFLTEAELLALIYLVGLISIGAMLKPRLKGGE